MRHTVKSDRALFLEALKLWDRPSEELHTKAFDADVDTDSFIDRALSLPSAGVLRD